MNPLDVSPDEQCCEVCGQGGEHLALVVILDGLIACKRCAVWQDLMEPRRGVA